MASLISLMVPYTPHIHFRCDASCTCYHKYRHKFLFSYRWLIVVGYQFNFSSKTMSEPKSYLIGEHQSRLLLLFFSSSLKNFNHQPISASKFKIRLVFFIVSHTHTHQTRMEQKDEVKRENDVNLRQ